MSTLATWPTQAQSWMDERGKPAWIAAMVLGFILFWPVGLAILAYLIWSKRMFNGNCHHRRHGPRHMGMGGKGMGRRMGCCGHRDDAQSADWQPSGQSSGNSAFDAYKEDTLRRLEEEQENFDTFLARLRESKDKAEFDAFMADRAAKAAQADTIEAEAKDVSPKKGDNGSDKS